MRDSHRVLTSWAADGGVGIRMLTALSPAAAACMADGLPRAQAGRL